MHPVASTVGSVFGLIFAFLPMYLLGLLAGLAFKSQEPDQRAIVAAMGAWIATYLISGFGFRDDLGNFNFGAGFLYLPAAAIAWFILRQHYRKMWLPDDEEAERSYEP